MSVQPVKFDRPSAVRIAKTVRRVEAFPVNAPGEARGGPGEFRAIQAAVTAVTVTADGIKYSLRRGHWDGAATATQGAWVDDSGGIDEFGYGMDPGMLPPGVGEYVWAIFRGTTAYYSIVGRPGGGPTGYITGAASASGTYAGVILVPPAADAPAGTTLAVGDFGTAGEEILIENAKEVTLGTHDLTDAANTFDFVCPGMSYLRTNADGTKVFGIDKVFVGCDDSDDDGPAFGF
jgi:hypothetical protein